MIQYILNDVILAQNLWYLLCRRFFYDRAYGERIANFITTCERVHFTSHFAKRTDTMNGELIGGSTYPAFNDFPSVHHMLMDGRKWWKVLASGMRKYRDRSSVVRNRTTTGRGGPFYLLRYWNFSCSQILLRNVDYKKVCNLNCISSLWFWY